MHALWAGLEPHAFGEARRLIRRVDVGAGESLWKEGDPSPGLVYVETGKVAIERGGVRIDTSGPGEVVGEMSLFAGRPRTASVVAIEPTAALVVDRPSYESLRSSGNDVVRNLERRVLDLQGARLRRLDAMIAAKVAPERNPYKKPSPGVFARILSMLGRNPATDAAPIVPRAIDTVAVLSRSPLFEGEPASSLGMVAIQLEQRAFAPGTFLTRQGEPGEHLYIVAMGTVDVMCHVPTSDDAEAIVRVGELGPGGACGLTSLDDDRGRLASAVCRDQVDALLLDRARWKRWVNEGSRVASTIRAAVIRAYADQIATAGAKLVSAMGARASLDLSIAAEMDLTKSTSSPTT